jgi:peptide deformylase
MAIQEIRTGEADPILRQKAVPVEAIDESLLQLIDDMFETMREAHGIGLAAPQVGVSRRLIVVDISEMHPEYPPIALINPVIMKAEDEALGEEGCLSLPGVRAIIRRAENVIVRGRLPSGAEIAFEGTGLMARVLQHEIDHLDGLLITDRLIPEDQRLLKREPEPLKIED